MQSVSLVDDKVMMTITDEVEEVGRVRVYKVLTYLYAELCQRSIFNKFQCEGCDENWPSQRDHECCIRSEEDIFDSFYDDVKNDVDLEMLHNLCVPFTKLVGIPMTTEWNEFISNFPGMSTHIVFTIWQDMMHSWEDDLIITDFVNMMCDTMHNSSAWSQDTFDKFKLLMTN